MLGLNTESGGDYTPIVKFDARAGRFFRMDRVQDSGGEWVTNSVEITDHFKAIFDFENIEVGYVLFAPGLAPSWSMVKFGEEMPAKPSDQHKQAFRVMVKLGKTCGGDRREFSSQAKAVIAAIDAVYTEWSKARDAHPGKLPVVVLKGTVPITTTGRGQSSTNYRPNFEIVDWVDRPPELGGPAGASPPPPPAPPPLPPQAAAPPAPVMADDEF
jgi:hypothetical protein